ncbi:hypothetical protein LLH03_04785 [bacterium]|nr:hypothetical protein [bacterium]
MNQLIFGAALWAFCLFGLALHSADIQQRHRRGTMATDQYEKPRPLEWLLACLILFAAAAAGLGLLEFWGLWEPLPGATARYQVYVGAGLTAAALAYLGIRGANLVHRAKGEFLALPGSTTSVEGELFVQVDKEAITDARTLRRIAWPAYGLCTIPGIFAGYMLVDSMPVMLPLTVIGVLSGGGLLVAILSGLPRAEEDEDW